MKKKTATILIHHVFGTKSTIFVSVSYRGYQLWHSMQNESISTMLKLARDWATNEGFTHVKIVE